MKKFLLILSLLFLLSSCGKVNDFVSGVNDFANNAEEFSKQVEEYGKQIEGITNLVPMVTLENSGNSQVCNIIKDNDIKQNCIKACFPTEVFAGTESMYTPEKDNECFNSFVSMWAKKELDVGICNHTNTDEFHYVCNTGVIEEKKKQNKSVSTLDCGGISSDKLYDACIGVVAIYNISESTCNETITKDGKAVCLLYVCQAYPEESKQLACFQRISGM